MTADDALTSKVRVERRLWARIPQTKTLGKVFSLNKSKIETKSNLEHENNDDREDNATTERDRSADADSSTTHVPTTFIKHKSEREDPPDEESTVGDGQSVATGISSVSGISRRSTRWEKFKAVPISSRSISHRSSSTASSRLSGIRDDLSTAYSASTRMTHRYSSDEDDDDDDLGLPFSAFDGTIDALRVLMGDIDDNSNPGYSDSSSDSESECYSLNESSACESESVASCRTEGSLHGTVPNASVVVDKVQIKNNDTIEGPITSGLVDKDESKNHGRIAVPNASVSVDKDARKNNGKTIHDFDDMSTVTATVKHLVEIILEKTDTMPDDTSKQDKSVGGHRSSHLGPMPQEISRSIKRKESDGTGYGITEGSISIQAKPSTEGHEVDISTMMSDAFESTKGSVVSPRDIIDPALTLNTDDVVEVSLVEFQTVQSEMLDSKQRPLQQISDDVVGDAATSSPSNADKGTGMLDPSGTGRTMPTVGPSRDSIGRYTWLKGLGSQLSRKAGARKSSTESMMPAQSEEVYDEEQSINIDQSPRKEENEAKDNVGDTEGLEHNLFPLHLDEHRDKAALSVGEEESPLAILTQNSNYITPSVNQGEPSTGPKTKGKPRLFARLDKLGRKNAEGPNRRSGTPKLEIDNIPIIPTGSTYEAQDSSRAHSGLSINDVAEASLNLGNVSRTKPVILSTQGSREAEEVEMDLQFTSLSKANSTTFDSSSVTPKEVGEAISINDDQQPSIANGKSQSIEADTDEKMKSGPVEYETRSDTDGEQRIELAATGSSQAELKQDHDTNSTLKNVTEDAAEGGSSHPETCLSSMFCCFLHWESKGPIICCEHCQKPLLAGDESVEDDVGDPRCGMKAEFHSKCLEERGKLKEKKKKVIGQIRLFGHLKRKHLRRQRTLRKLRALEEAKKSNGNKDHNDDHRRQERKQVDEESRKHNHFMSRVLGRASNRDGSPYKTRDEGRDDGGTARRRRLEMAKTRESLSPNCRREQRQHSGVQVKKTSRSMSPMRRDRGHDHDTNDRPPRRRLREGSPLRKSYYQRGQVSPRNTSISRKKVQEAISHKRTRSLPRRPSPMRRQQSQSTGTLRKVRFSGIPNTHSASSSRTGSRSRHGNPQRMERHDHKKSKSVVSPGRSLLKRTLNSSRGDDDDGYGINLEDYKVVKIKGIV